VSGQGFVKPFVILGDSIFPCSCLDLRAFGRYAAGMNDCLPIVLASASPRRADLLRQIGVDFIAFPAEIDESYKAGEDPASHALRLAIGKAGVVAQQIEKGLVIGADTIVVVDGAVLGKPANREEAARMLQRLSGWTHQVITGIALVRSQPRSECHHVETTEVRFRDLSADEIWDYVDSGEPMDKAGAYAIQGRGALFVSGIDGCYHNVVGLPLFALGQLFSRMGCPLLLK